MWYKIEKTVEEQSNCFDNRMLSNPNNGESSTLNQIVSIIADMEANRKLSPTVTELILRDRKFDIALVFIS